MEELEDAFEEVILRPSRGGVFEVALDGRLIASKKSSGSHTDNEEIVAALRRSLEEQGS